MVPNKSPLALLSELPTATLFAVLFSLFTGVIHLVDVDKLSFEDYMTQVTIVWGGLAVGRGLAASKGVSANPTIALLNAFPWATVVAAIVGVVGYVSVLVNTDGSLDWKEYGVQMGTLVGALGIGRGIAALKHDTTNVLEPEDDKIDLVLVDDKAGIEEYFRQRGRVYLPAP
jgi:hypothetical protein